jgi:hypothetical protein
MHIVNPQDRTVAGQETFDERDEKSLGWTIYR